MHAVQQNENLRGVYQQLAADTRPDGKGKIYAFSSPRTGAGTSYITRNMAMIAASQTQTNQHVLLLDMDLQLAYLSRTVMMTAYSPEKQSYVYKTLKVGSAKI